MEEQKDEESKTIYSLEADNELRIEVAEENGAQLELTEGQAEIFGTEITRNHKYKFQPGATIAVFTWHGCKLAIKGETEVAYISKESPMRVYLNTHAALEQMREKAEKENTRGPRVMIVGPTDVGKSTLSSILVNYATRVGRAPMLVDLDVGVGQMSIPGTMGALVVESPADVVKGFSDTAPIVFHFGHKTPADNLQLYNLLISRIAEVVNMRCDTIPRASTSGVIINTCGWIKGGGYQSIVHTAGSFEVDVIIVLDQERLYNELVRDMPAFVKVVHHPKSGGVVERSQKKRMQIREKKIKEYFYGLENSLFPHTFEVSFSDVKLFKIGAPALPDSMLPLGTKSQDNGTKVVPLTPSTSLVHRVVSVSAATSTEDDLVQTNVLGFIVITEVKMEKEVFTVLSPSPCPLPRSICFVMEDIQFMEIQ